MIFNLAAIRGRTRPVRLLAPGRVFRPGPEDAAHLNVFHQVDGICVAANADMTMLKATVQRLLDAVLGPAELRWTEHAYGFVEQGFEVAIKPGDQWLDVSGSGTLSAATLRQAGFEPAEVKGFAWGMGLERLAMVKFGIDDLRTLWQPPYV